MSSVPITTRAVTIDALRGDRKRMRRDRVMRRVLLLTALTSIVISALIIFVLFEESVRFLQGLIDTAGLSALWDSGAAAPGWYPRNDRFDLVTIIAGTLLVSGIAVLVAAPLGLGAAIYLSEYASPRMRKWLKPILEILAGVPSIVFGFFALRVLAPDLIQPLFNTPQTTSLLVTGVAIGILVTPLMASVSEDALGSVPSALREASVGLGARRSTTTIKVVLPAAVSGIVAALIISTSRAVGETMVAALASGALGQAPRTVDPRETGLTMTAAMAQLARGSDNVVGSGNAFQSLFFVGALLFFMTLGLNLIADRVVRRVRNKY